MERFYEEILSYVINEYNIDLSIYDEGYTEKRIGKWMLDNNLQTSKAFFLKCENEDDYISKFYNSFHNGYTTFFRYPLTYISFKKELFNSFMEHKRTRPLRIWSIGSSKGQEAYSIAIAIEDVKTKYNLKIDYRIFGTDISKSSLSYANTGLYKASELDNVTFKQLYKYFVKSNQNYQVISAIRSHVSFSYHDIVLNNLKSPSESIFGDFDYIFFCNVAIYYKPDVQKDIVNRIYKTLSKTGYIVTSPTESALLNDFPNIKELSQPTSIFMKTEKE